MLNLVTRETLFQFQYQAQVPAPMSLAWNYTCNLIVNRFVDSRNWYRSRPKCHRYLVYHLLGIISPNSFESVFTSYLRTWVCRKWSLLRVYHGTVETHHWAKGRAGGRKVAPEGSMPQTPVLQYGVRYKIVTELTLIWAKERKHTS